MTKLYTVLNSSRKRKDIFAKNETQAAEIAILLGLGKKTSSMKVKEYDLSKHKPMEQNYLMLLECRNAIGEMKKNPSINNGDWSNSDDVFDFDGCFVALATKGVVK